MKILICIDDTDDLEKDISTGAIAQMILKTIEKSNLGKCSPITRHQLLLHEDIPYTSHNSSMCFKAEINNDSYDLIVKKAIEILKENKAPDSDPGLCIAREDSIKNKDLLTRFGYKAKREVLTKDEAYDLADEINIHLTEHGGSGLGVIGALAGVGLRMSGNDGEFKGRIGLGKIGSVLKVKEIVTHSTIDEVKTLSGKILEDDEEIYIGEMVKAILMNGQVVLLVTSSKKEVILWQTCTKQQVRKFGDERDVL